MSAQSIIQEAVSIIGVPGIIVLGFAFIVVLALIIWSVLFIDE